MRLFDLFKRHARPTAAAKSPPRAQLGLEILGDRTVRSPQVFDTAAITHTPAMIAEVAQMHHQAEAVAAHASPTGMSTVFGPKGHAGKIEPPAGKVELMKPLAAGGGNEPEQIIDLIPVVEPRKGHFTQHIEQQAGDAAGKKASL